MFKIKLSNNISKNIGNVVAIGNFDGMHLGHQQIFNKVKEISALENIQSTIITFEPLPKEFIVNNNKLLRLSLIRDKLNFVKKLAIDNFIVLRFNKFLQLMLPEDFIKEILLVKLNVTHVVVGNDFRFGYMAEGNINLLRKFGINVIEIPPYLLNNQRVSSSLIRSYTKQNLFTEVKCLLGHNITYTSKIVYGNQLGRKYGVPTINLLLVNKIPILWGIYFAYVYIDHERYDAVVSCGQNPTVTTTKNYKLEAHLLGVDLNLYGKIATIEILDFLRPELKFDNLEQLFAKIYNDLQIAKNYFYRLK
jgi:riboflavin kinase/FMN adenylyltransferase